MGRTFYMVCILFYTICGTSLVSWTQISAPAIIPAPQKLIVKDGVSTFENKLSHELMDWNEYELTIMSNINAIIDEAQSSKKVLSALTVICPVENTKNKGYTIQIADDQITIRAHNPLQRQYAMTTLMQIFRQYGKVLPNLEIEDWGRFDYRGMHLDVARHFFTLDEVKKYIDFLAAYKFNVFHWHLTEDQGWRLEIKKYPNLTETGAWRNRTLIGHYGDQPHQFDHTRYGGYYTQEEAREVVRYAAERNITVIPEIELPGHSLAALASYPHLGCTGGPYEVTGLWGVFDDVYCPKESTFEFLFDVLKEVIEIFPSTYIHIGGDECPKVRWKKCSHCQKLIKEQKLKNEQELQSYFIKRIENFLNENGRQIIGWDEILEGGLAPNATVMSWRGESGGVEAANAGHNVVMTPTSYCYFDYYQSRMPGEPLAIGGYLPIEQVYKWNPIPAAVSKEKHHHILGGQGNVWTEYIKTFPQVEYMAYARAMALSEVLWGTSVDYKNFVKRFNLHYRFLSEKGINLANHSYELKPKIMSGNGQYPKISFDIPEDAVIKIAGNDVLVNASGHIIVDSSKTLILSIVNEGIRAESLKLHFDIHKAVTGNIKCDCTPSRRYTAEGWNTLIDGLLAEPEHLEKGWIGVSGQDCQLILELDRTTDVSQVSINLLQDKRKWIYFPSEIHCEGSADGVNYKNIGTFKKFDDRKGTFNLKMELENQPLKNIRIKIKNFGPIPKDMPGAGHLPLFFIDEIVVR